MSLFLGLKESVSIPTGLLWFASSITTLILGNHYKKEIIALSSDTSKLIY